MKLIRHSRFATALLVLVSMLFMQLAVAAYACPNLQSPEIAAGGTPVVENCDQPMAGDGKLDAAAPNLCYSHCDVVQLSVDQPQTAKIPALATTDFLVVPIAFEVTSRSSTPRFSLLLARANDPPLAIRNCCFRI